MHQVPPAGAAGSGSFGMLPPPPGPPPPPATYYRVRLVGTAWDELDGRTWVHREPRDRTLGDMLRRLQKSLAGNCPVGTPITPLPANGSDGAHEGKAHVQIIAVEPVYSAMDDDASNVHPNSPANSPKAAKFSGGAVGGEEFPVASAFVFDAPFMPQGAPKPSGPEAALRITWRCRTTARVEGKFPGLCARLLVTDESTTEMSPAASAAEMLRAQSRAIAAAATAWEELRNGATSSAVVGVVGGVSANAAAVDDAASAAAVAGCLGALQRSLQGSLAAGVNGGVPAICRAFSPEEESRKRAMSDQSSQTPEIDEEDEESDNTKQEEAVTGSPKPPVDPRAMTSEDRSSLLAALEDFLSACARAVEVHGTATRMAATGKPRGESGASTIEQMQGMFVRCLAEIRRDITVISDREKDVDNDEE